MPIFVFECQQCGARRERILASAERADDERVLCDSMSCPTFGTDKESEMVRVWAPANAHFKGSGFHATDYPNQPRPSKG
jgi:predicted nucleic acid-binding Zn ribbon protein